MEESPAQADLRTFPPLKGREHSAHAAAVGGKLAVQLGQNSVRVGCPLHEGDFKARLGKVQGRFDAADTGADMLVMGGYGTPKLREVMLGGVTRTLFECMTVPVFMSH